MLVELWKLAVIEGFVENGIPGWVNTPVSIAPAGTGFEGHSTRSDRPILYRGSESQTAFERSK